MPVTVIACWEQVLAGDVTVMSYFIILVGERCVTVLAGDGRSMSTPVVVTLRREWYLLGEYFVYFVTLQHDVLVEV